jgi:predicted dehydrogenase
MFRAAIVGCGHIGKGHAKAYARCREIQLAAVVDERHQCATDLGNEHHVPCYASLEDALAAEEIDFVDVCTPSGAHAEVAIAAAEADRHCICEKPLEITPQRCDTIIAAFEQSGTTLGCIFQHRFADDVRKTKDAIEAGRFGRLTLAACLTPWWRTQEYYDSGQWRGTWRLDGGGALMNQSIHAIDLLVWLAGPIRTITARTALLAHERIEVEDVAVALCEFESGALGVIQGTTSAYPGSGVRHEVMGTSGTAYLTADCIEMWKLRDQEEEVVADAAAPVEDESASDPTVVGATIFARNLDDIARAAREGRPPLVSGLEARKSVEVICAIYESARRGEPVTLPLREFHP